MPPQSRIQLLSEKKFWEIYQSFCLPVKNAEHPKVRKAVFDELKRLDGILRPAIDARWKETEAYYEFNDNWNVSWHHSMGVYSDEMCCTEFLTVIQRALAQMEHDWCFHVSLECDQDLGWGLQQAGVGQIFFYQGKIYGRKKNKFNYALFET